MITPDIDQGFVLAGDWHGSVPQGETIIRHAEKRGYTVIVHLGDFGIWSDDRHFLHKLNTKLEKAGITLYFVDGNHENFDLLYEYPLIEDGTRQIRSNIFHLPRGYRFEWHGISFLALGGAASIDLEHRTPGKTWWIEEAITDEDVATAQDGGRVDVMLCHDSPEGAPNSITDDPVGQSRASRYFGHKVMQYCRRNREQLKKVTDVTTPHLLFHGHYHMYMSGRYNHADGTTGHVVGLHQGQAGWLGNAFEFKFDKFAVPVDKTMTE